MNPLYNPVFLGKIAKSYLVDVNRVWRSNEEEIRRYQDNSLRQVVKFAYTVPLYHTKYHEAGIHPNDIRGIHDIEKLPLVTKKDLRGKPAELLLPAKANVATYSMVSTSGSTGEPVTLYSDPYTIFRTFIGFVRMIREHDVNWRKTRMALIADLSPDSAEDAYFRRTALPSLRSFFTLDNMKAFHVGEKPEKLIKDIEAFNPEFIGGYPEMLKILALLKRQGKGKTLEPRSIATSGAIVDEHTRECIEKAFNTKLFDVYGATECSPMAFQCKQGNYHIHSDFVHMEFMDPKEKEASSGDGGNIIITRLFGRGTPIVRYTGINDFVVQSQRRCTCGMHTPLIEKIEGRSVDCIILPNGEFVPPSSFTGIPHKVMHMFHTDKIEQFQIIQQSVHEVDILLVIDEQLRNVGPKVDELVKEIKKQFEKKFGKAITITVREVDRIQMTRPGSAIPPPFVISKVNQPMCR